MIAFFGMVKDFQLLRSEFRGREFDTDNALTYIV